MNLLNPKSIDREKTEAEILYMDQDELDNYLQNLDLSTMASDDITWLGKTLRQMAEGYEERVKLISREIRIRNSAKSR